MEPPHGSAAPLLQQAAQRARCYLAAQLRVRSPLQHGGQAGGIQAQLLAALDFPLADRRHVQRVVEAGVVHRVERLLPVAREEDVEIRREQGEEGEGLEGEDDVDMNMDADMEQDHRDGDDYPTSPDLEEQMDEDEAYIQVRGQARVGVPRGHLPLVDLFPPVHSHSLYLFLSPVSLVISLSIIIAPTIPSPPRI